MSWWIPFIDPVMRIVSAAIAGTILGLNRDLRGKPTGVRTLGLVSTSAALITVAALNLAGGYEVPGLHIEAVIPVVQGVLTGIGFVGAGVILRGADHGRVRGLTTAATVWSSAIVGLVCGLGDWLVLGVGVVIIIFLLTFGGVLERRVREYFRSGERTTAPIPPLPPAT